LDVDGRLDKLSDSNMDASLEVGVEISFAEVCLEFPLETLLTIVFNISFEEE
jgi:hypothetical protein